MYIVIDPILSIIVEHVKLRSMALQLKAYLTHTLTHIFLDQPKERKKKVENNKNNYGFNALNLIDVQW